MVKPSNRLETWGNESTMNMNAIIHTNVLASPYFKSLYEKKTYHEVIDEIYNQVASLDPFVKGTTASTAFCLLYKLWTLRLTVKQVQGLLDHPDSPHIRGLGFLYLRYVCKPQNLWDWFSGYLNDEEEIQLTKGPNPKIITIGKLCHMLLTEQKFLGTMLPRIPVPVAKEIEQQMQEHSRQNRTSSASKDKAYDDRRHRNYDDESDRHFARRNSRSLSPRSPRFRRDDSYSYRDREESRRNRRYSRSRSHSRERYRRDDRSRSRSRDRHSRYRSERRSYDDAKERRREERYRHDYESTSRRDYGRNGDKEEGEL
ncbi:uncharacterized protein VTP21DRAFT_7032 [Calcarisporiella thermophila]|uniref:uncharacterized protein n=1 Tax=Calcarisporiella thermophila TaxID=911321 RepID=UPI003741ED5C